MPVPSNPYGEEDDDAIMALMGPQSAKNAKGGGGPAKNKESQWASIGIPPALLRSVRLRGFATPTPIQKAAIPYAINTPPRDVVAMARTGSGKTLAYLLPLISRLGSKHSTKFGVKAVILCPGRELALQILRVGKELVRGCKDKGSSKTTMDDEGDTGPQSANQEGSLRWGVVVGGESLDDQFQMIAENPDVLIATPGRLLHLIVEMNLDLRSVDMIVFDEADRLFEMGFASQLNEILQRLPPSRQSLLFSATLPSSLIEFSKAGLTNPKLIRLDAEQQISADLRMSFFSVKPAEKEAALLCLLKDVIGLRTIHQEAAPTDQPRKGSNQALVFVATKHHVEFISTMLRTAGFSTSQIYGAMDQTARKKEMDDFRRGHTSVLVVTDVAARGIDIPVLEHVINYDFPSGSRVFVHRVGRTARAGQKGSAWSFVTNSELPFLLDLQLFLGKPLAVASALRNGDEASTDNMTLGTVPRDALDSANEHVLTVLFESNNSLATLRDVMRKGQSMYERSQGKASPESYRRAKIMVKDPKWGLAGTPGDSKSVHPVFARSKLSQEAFVEASGVGGMDEARQTLLQAVSGYAPRETIFEVGSRGGVAGAVVMKARRQRMASRKVPVAVPVPTGDNDDEDQPILTQEEAADAYKDSAFYLSHRPAAEAQDRGYSLRDGASFAEQASGAAFDLTGDDGIAQRVQKASQLTWDRKKKKYIKGDGAGSDNKKLITTESGARMPASYRSGRFEDWKKSNRVMLPKIGEAEGDSGKRGPSKDKSSQYRNKSVTEAKPLDPKSTTYERKLRKQQAIKEAGPKPGAVDVQAKKRELRSTEDIRKARKLADQRRAKNARPSGGKGKGKGKGRK